LLRIKVFWLFLCAISAVVAGCTSQPAVRLPYCPPPYVPACKPGAFTQTILDTTRPKPGQIHYHITRLPETINTDANEFSLTFIPVGKEYPVLLNTDRNRSASGIQRVYPTSFVSTVSFGPVGEFDDVNLPLPMGSAYYCKANGMVYFAGKANNTDPNDYDLFVAKPNVQAGVVTLKDAQPIQVLSKERFFDSQPALTPDGKTIYFASDRPNGEGGTDIWYATRSQTTSENWSEPKVLPAPINTPCDEITPYVSADGKLLYFSSNGHETVGGYDLFRAERAGNDAASWKAPGNMGKPINTASDEIFPVLLNDTAFFYASDQQAPMGGMNIYTITRTEIPIPGLEARGAVASRNDVKHNPIRNPKDTGSVTVKGNVLSSHDTVAPAGTQVFWRDAETSQEVGRKPVERNGEFSLQLERGKVYDIGAESEKTFYDFMRLDLRNEIDSVVNITLRLPDTLIVRINFPFDDYSHPTKYVIGDNGEELSMTWEQSLDLAAKSINAANNEISKVILIGHTDSLGTDAYNDRLGLNRATFVANELKKRGVRANVLSVQSKGRRFPVARREGEEDEIFRLRSRRVEFIKVYKTKK